MFFLKAGKPGLPMAGHLAMHAKNDLADAGLGAAA
jgi:hypothetical protein